MDTLQPYLHRCLPVVVAFTAIKDEQWIYACMISVKSVSSAILAGSKHPRFTMGTVREDGVRYVV